MNTLQQLVKRAVELFKDDTLAASIVTSWIESKQVWYVSVVRWLGPRSSMERKVLLNVTDADLETAYADALRRLG